MKTKTKTTIAVVIAIAFVIFFITIKTLIVLESKGIENFKKTNNELLKQAIETGNYELCDEHSAKFVCVSLLARRDITICDSFFEKFGFEMNFSEDIESQYPIVCRASVLEDPDLCIQFRRDETKPNSYCDMMVPGLISEVSVRMMINAEEAAKPYEQKLENLGFTLIPHRNDVKNNSVFTSYNFEDGSGKIIIEVINGKAEYITLNNETDPIDEFFNYMEKGAEILSS